LTVHKSTRARTRALAVLMRRGVHGRGTLAIAVLTLVVGLMVPTLAPPRKNISDAAATLAPQRARQGRVRPVRFVALGDFGSGTRTQQQVAKTLCRWRRTHPFDLVVTTGDNIYPDGSATKFEPNFFRPYACLLSKGVRFRASLGNHDVKTDNGRPELEEPAFGMKGRNYVVRAGGVRFVMADSNALRRRWVRRATRSHGARWTIVVFHHPVYSAGTEHGSTPGFAGWMPRLFRKRGVDLVLNGHDHIYSATRPLRGIRYVVSGGGGDKLYGCGPKWFSVVCRERHHFLYVVARRDAIKIRAVSAQARVFHRFSTPGIP
jgi:hypothetical protein